MILTSKETLKEVQQLVDNYFQANSLLDNIVYDFNYRFIQNNFIEYLHKQISHLMPQLADKITDFGVQTNDRFFRGAIAENNLQFSTISDGLRVANEFINKIEEQIQITINMAVEQGDQKWEDFMRDFSIKEQAIVSKQLDKLLKAAVQYEKENNIGSFNKDFDSFNILGG